MTLESLLPVKDEKPLDNISPDGGYTAIFRRIGVVGDSLSSGEFESLDENGNKGYHDYFEYSWGQYIGRMCGSTCFNFSRGGMTAKEYCQSFADNMRFWDPQYACQCYIIALGVNDIHNQGQEVGTVDDINREDYTKNADTFVGWYARIIQHLKEIQPRAKFFLTTIPAGEERRDDAKSIAHRDAIYAMADYFDNTYVIDLYQYAPPCDEEFRKNFFMGGHMNAMGYIFMARIISSYIDWIIRNNFEDFREVPFIGTDLKG